MTTDVSAYAIGIAANDSGCNQGPRQLQHSSYLQNLSTVLQWLPLIETQEQRRQLDALPAIQSACQNLATNTASAIKHHHLFLTLGGDHSSAIGTWSGAAAALQAQGSLGLIWFDAHMDSHTPTSSHSKNIHGMPLACLLGHGPTELTSIANASPKLQPENVALIGIRSYEPEERALLEQLGVHIYYMSDIKQRGLRVIVMEALHIVSQQTAGFGISIDLDGFDPQDAPGVGVPEVDGVIATDFLEELPSIAQHPKFVGAEIVEFNPSRDIDQRTERLVVKLIGKLFHS